MFSLIFSSNIILEFINKRCPCLHTWIAREHIVDICMNLVFSSVVVSHCLSMIIVYVASIIVNVICFSALLVT